MIVPKPDKPEPNTKICTFAVWENYFTLNRCYNPTQNITKANFHYFCGKKYHYVPIFKTLPFDFVEGCDVHLDFLSLLCPVGGSGAGFRSAGAAAG